MNGDIKVDEQMHGELAFLDDVEEGRMIFIPFCWYGHWGIYHLVRSYELRSNYYVELRPLFASEDEAGAWYLFRQLVDEIDIQDLESLQSFLKRLSDFQEI